MSDTRTRIRRGDWRVVAASLLLLVATALLDYLTPPQVNFGLIYMLAVLPVAWFCGWRLAVVVAVIAAALEGINSEVLRALPWEINTWNALSRITVLSLIAVVADRLYIERAQLRRVNAERTTLLRLLEREFPRPIKALGWFSRMLDESLERGMVDAARNQLAPLRHHIRETEFLATDLLAVGTLQAHALPSKQEDVDLRVLVKDAADGALERGRVVLQLPSAPAEVRCDPDHVRHAIAIVLERFLRQPYLSVTLWLRTASADAVLEVSSQGPALDKADYELADLLIAGGGGRLVVVPRNAKRGAVVSLYFPLAHPAARPAVATLS